MVNTILKNLVMYSNYKSNFRIHTSNRYLDEVFIEFDDHIISDIISMNDVIKIINKLNQMNKIESCISLDKKYIIIRRN